MSGNQWGSVHSDRRTDRRKLMCVCLCSEEHGEEPLREFWMNEEKGLHLGRNGVPSIQTNAQTDLLN